MGSCVSKTSVLQSRRKVSLENSIKETTPFSKETQTDVIDPLVMLMNDKEALLMHLERYYKAKKTNENNIQVKANQQSAIIKRKKSSKHQRDLIKLQHLDEDPKNRLRMKKVGNCTVIRPIHQGNSPIGRFPTIYYNVARLQANRSVDVSINGSLDMGTSGFPSILRPHQRKQDTLLKQVLSPCQPPKRLLMRESLAQNLECSSTQGLSSRHLSSLSPCQVTQKRLGFSQYISNEKQRGGNAVADLYESINQSIFEKSSACEDD